MLSFFDSSKRKLKKYKKEIKKIKDLSSLTNQELVLLAKKEIDNISLLSIVKEAAKRTLHKNPFDVQLIGALSIIENNIIEMKTGEGKSLTAAIAATVLALKERQVYVISVNDYLVKRDREEHFPLFDFFSLSSGVIYSGEPSLFYKKGEYQSDIIYATATELGFDYLRDNMVQTKEQKAQKQINIYENGEYTGFKPSLDFVIIDEVDSILIDEANTPLIISEEIEYPIKQLKNIDKLVKSLIRGNEIEKKEFLEINKVANGDFILDDKTLSVYLTEEGIKKIENFLNIDNLFNKEGEQYIHLIENAIRANYYYKKNIHYIIQNEEVILIDQNTGRLSYGRQLSEGQHQAIEAKENLNISPFSISKGEISYQKFFKLFKNVSGMTGTALTEKEEFLEIYDLEVIEIPTNKPIIREDLNDKIFLTKEDKLKYFLKLVKEINKKGQPILIGTSSVEVNEFLSKEMKKEGLKFNVLNAKNIEKENEIIAEAGKEFSITLATNMAGRGVDIKLTETAKEKGGLFVIGYERYDNRRIDNQLRGRSGRQGDPGKSIFLVSFEDSLLTIFGETEKIKKKLEIFKTKENPNLLDLKIFQKFIEKAQITIENANFEGRKNILQFDNIIGKQREVIYSLRNKILDPIDPGEKINDLLNFIVEEIFTHEYLTETEIIENTKRLLGIDFYMEDKLLAKKMIGSIIYDKFKIYNNDLELIEKTIRYIYLRNIDKEWINHLTILDNLKQGIYLRQYNQKDPIIEFQKEAFFMFQELIPTIKRGIIKDLMYLNINPTNN